MTQATGAGTDVARRRAQRLAENALPRQQLLVPRRGGVRPAMVRADRAFLMRLAGRVRAWREASLLSRPETLLRRHRAGFRARWRRESRPRPGRPPRLGETVAPIRRVAGEHPRWGAARIRGEPQKPGLRVAKRTCAGRLVRPLPDPGTLVSGLPANRHGRSKRPAQDRKPRLAS